MRNDHVACRWNVIKALLCADLLRQTDVDTSLLEKTMPPLHSQSPMSGVETAGRSSGGCGSPVTSPVSPVGPIVSPVSPVAKQMYCQSWLAVEDFCALHATDKPIDSCLRLLV